MLNFIYFSMWFSLLQRIIDGDEEEKMVRLYDYRLELMKTHPGSTIVIECSEGGFLKLSMCAWSH